MTRIKPMLVPLAAAGLVVIMMLATRLHVMRGESPLPAMILGTLAAFVAWGRWRKAPHFTALTRGTKFREPELRASIPGV